MDNLGEKQCTRCGDRAIAPCPLCGKWLCPKCFEYSGADTMTCSECLELARSAGLDDEAADRP